MQNKVDFSDVFDVTNEEFFSIISKAAGPDNLKSFEIVEKNDIDGYKGYCGEKVVINVRYELLDCSVGEVRLFVKKLHWDTIQESIHFLRVKGFIYRRPSCMGASKRLTGRKFCLWNTLRTQVLIKTIEKNF